MSLLHQHLSRAIVRTVSTQGASKQTNVTIATVNDEDLKTEYYHKMGKRTIENLERLKPEGWDQAKPFKTVPGPKPLPLIGNLWRFLPGGEYYKMPLIDMHRRYKRLRDQYGNVVHLKALPGKPDFIFLYEPTDMEMALRNEGPWPLRVSLQSFVYYRKQTRADLFGDIGGVISEQGEKWFQIRSVINKILMNPRTAEMYAESMDEVTNDLIANITRFSKSNPKKEMPEDFQNELYKWTLESIGVIAFNRRIGTTAIRVSQCCLRSDMSPNSEGQQLINSALSLFDLLYKLDVLPSLWTLYSTRNWRKLVQVCDFFSSISLKYIDECLANADPNPDIPDHERSVLERLAKIDKRIAFAMTTDMLVAGIDTTGRTMAAALYYLSKNPNKQALLREEIKRHLPRKDTPVTKEMLREMRYLKAVIKETTRLAPIAIGNLRTSIKDLVLGGYQVPKGTSVITINIVPCHDEKHFVKATEFIPERWLRTTDDELSYKNAHPFIFLPFGFGPRSCIGKRLANLELEIGLSKIIRNFELSWNYPEPRFESTLLYGIADPVKIKVEELNN